MVICSGCETLYKDGTNSRKGGHVVRCPAFGCEGTLVECDDILVDVVLSLIRKGYRVTGAGSGHPHGIAVTEIVMAELADFPILPKGFEEVEVVRGLSTALVKTHKGSSRAEDQQSICRGVIDLLNWIPKIPTYFPKRRRFAWPDEEL